MMIASGATRLGLTLIAAAAVLAVSCNRRAPVLESDVLVAAPSGWANATALDPPGGDLARIDIAPPVVIGGGSGQGTVFLDSPAGAGGRVVSLSAATGTVTLTPSVVTVPPGSVSADFAWSTLRPAIDTDVPITASTPDRSRSSQLTVWSPSPTSVLYFMSDRAGFTAQQFGRVTADRGGRFLASCTGNVVIGTAGANGLGYSVRFAAAGGRPLVPGVYENATANQSGHHMQLPVSPSCAYVGRFEVHELEAYTNGDVTNVSVSFEARCPGRDGVVRGEFRALNVARTSTARFTACPGGR